MTPTQHAWGAVAGTTGLIAATVGMAFTVPGLAGASPGNNGTVKIAEHGFFDDIPQNAPHQGCTFNVEWYGFDEGPDVVSSVTFTDHSPTGSAGLSVSGPATVFVGGDAASGAGNDFDGAATYTLSFTGEPHSQQGYHVKLTIQTPRSQGAMVKHKVFWVQGCVPPSSPPPTTPTSPPPTTPTSPPPTTPTSPPPTTPTKSQQAGGQEQVEVQGEQASVKPPKPQGEAVAKVPKAPVEVAGRQAQVPTVVNAGLAPETSAFGEAPAWTLPLAALGGGLLSLGVLLAWAGRRRRGGVHAGR